MYCSKCEESVYGDNFICDKCMYGLPDEDDTDWDESICDICGLEDYKHKPNCANNPNVFDG